MGDLLRKGGAAALVAAVALVAYRKAVELSDPKHSFVPSTPGFKSREERLSALKNGTYTLPTGFKDVTMVNSEGLFLRKYEWMPVPTVDEPIKGIVVIVHGFAEHMGRYEHVAKALNHEGFGVVGIDHQGHGRSEGDRAYFESSDNLANDVVQLVEEEKAKYPDTPFFLLGHSLGGLVAFEAYVKTPKLWKAVTLCAPSLVPPADVNAVTKFAALQVASLLPKLRVDELNLSSLVAFSEVRDIYMNDPMIRGIGLLAGVAASMFNSWENVHTKFPLMTAPLLMLHGEKDTLVPIAASKALNAGAKSEKKKFVIVPGGQHELMNEQEDAMVKEMVGWFKSNL